MKKLLIVLTGVIVLFASCRKDRTCTCYYADGTSAGSKNYSNMTKKVAKADCDSYDTFYPGGCDLN